MITIEVPVQEKNYFIAAAYRFLGDRRETAKIITAFVILASVNLLFSDLTIVSYATSFVAFVLLAVLVLIPALKYALAKHKYKMSAVTYSFSKESFGYDFTTGKVEFKTSSIQRIDIRSRGIVINTTTGDVIIVADQAQLKDLVAKLQKTQPYADLIAA